LIKMTFFLTFALYAFSGAKIIRRLPFLNIVFKIIGIIYMLRGFAVFWFIYHTLMDTKFSHPWEILFSSISLIIGLLYFSGQRENSV